MGKVGKQGESLDAERLATRHVQQLKRLRHSDRQGGSEGVPLCGGYSVDV